METAKLAAYELFDPPRRILNALIKDELISHGASLVGFGDFTELPAEVRENLPMGICITTKTRKLSPEIQNKK